MQECFKTQHGLKIRLTSAYFTDLFYDFDTMCDLGLKIEFRFSYPAMLKWYFTIILMCAMPDVKLSIYFIVGIALFAFGIAISNIYSGKAISFIMDTIGCIYNILTLARPLPYLVVIVLGIFRSVPLTISFFILSAITSLLYLLVDKFIILPATYKKYGTHFHDTEMCAFIVLYSNSHTSMSYQEFIKNYCKYAINRKDQLRIVFALSPTRGYYVDTIVRTKDNAELIDKWTDNKCLYMVEMYKGGILETFYVSKEVFYRMKNSIETEEKLKEKTDVSKQEVRQEIIDAEYSSVNKSMMESGLRCDAAADFAMESTWVYVDNEDKSS